MGLQYTTFTANVWRHFRRVKKEGGRSRGKKRPSTGNRGCQQSSHVGGQVFRACGLHRSLSVAPGASLWERLPGCVERAARNRISYRPVKAFIMGAIVAYAQHHQANKNPAVQSGPTATTRVHRSNTSRELPLGSYPSRAQAPRSCNQTGVSHRNCARQTTNLTGTCEAV